MDSDLSAICVLPISSIRQTISCIDCNGKGIALVVDNEQHLIGIVTDGDIRRAILTGVNLDFPVKSLLERQSPAPHPTPITAPVDTPNADLLHMMNEYTLRHIPLVDQAGRVVAVALLSELAKDYETPLTAVIMAGGYGTRLRPLTKELPKSMLPVGDKPLLELIVHQLREAGIRQVNLATHYKADLIAQHFGDGQDFGVEIRYVKEDQPLGTAGALSLLDESEGPLLVMNGDILTRIDFGAMLDFHRDHQADMTVAVKQFEFQIPYAVIETNNVQITSISEKPVVRYFINAGIYLLNSAVCRYIPNGKPYDMPELIKWLMTERRMVISFPIREYWLDIGNADDYERAREDVKTGQILKRV